MTALSVSTPPCVSVAIPTRNRCKLLEMSIASVFNQRFTNWEIVVSNNCSNDGTAEMVERIGDRRIRLVNAPRSLEFEENVSNAVNACTGEYLILLSDDDLLMPEYLGEMVQAFRKSPRVTVGLGRRVLININNQATYVAPEGPAADVEGATFLERFFGEDQSQQVNTIFSLFCRRAQWHQTGGLPLIPAAFYSDTIPFIDLALQGVVAYRPNALFCYRYHQASTNASSTLDTWQLGAGMFWQQVQRSAPAWVARIGAERWARVESALAKYIAKHYASRIQGAGLPNEERDRHLRYAEQYPPR